MGNNIDTKTLEVVIHIHDAYLNNLIQAKDDADSSEYKKELKKLIKKAKKHSKKLNKLYKEIQLRELPDRVLIKHTKDSKIKKNKKSRDTEIEIVSVDKDTEITLENDEKILKSQLTGELDATSCVFGEIDTSNTQAEMELIIGRLEEDINENILDTLEAELKSDIEIKADEPKLENITSEIEIASERAKLPIDCELNGVKCIFTPQHKLIIKAENKIPAKFLSKVNKSAL